MVKHAPHGTVVVDAAALRNAFTVRGHRVGGVLQNKLVVAFQDALGVFSGEHPAIFRRVWLQVVIIRNVGMTVVNTQFQSTARVDFHLC